MKKITFLIAFIFCAYNINAQDTCDTAQAVIAGVHTVASIDGTEAPPVGSCAGGSDATMAEWYSYTSTENRGITVTTDLAQNAGGDTRIQVYEGSCGSLVCVTGDDDSGIVPDPDNGNSYLSIANFNALSGTTYYIAFDNRWSTNGFDFEIIEGDLVPFSFTSQSLPTTGSSRGVVDMNGDYLDDVVSTNSTNVNLQLQTSGGFTELDIPTTTADFPASWSLAAADYNADGFSDLIYGNGSGVTFMRSNGDMTFTEVSFPQYVFSQRSNFVDLNNDGHLDAFMCHDVDPSVYYINDGNGDLTYYQSGVGDAPYVLANFHSGGNYGSIWVDYDNDRNVDMFIAKCGGSDPERYVNQMHHNTGGVDNEFIENAAAIGLNDYDQTWSSAWGDFDNDGDMDVFIGKSSGAHTLKVNNGAPNYTFTDITGSSGISALTQTTHENLTFDLDNDGYLDIISHGNVLRNNGDLTFTLFANVFAGTGPFGDLNNDGFIDVYRGSNVYLNDGNGNNWIKITTVGTDSNINGIGARVEVHTASGTQIRDVRSGDGFEYMNSLNTHVGIGTDTSIDNIIIYWPSGIVDNIANPNINEHLVIIEGESLSIEDEALANIVIHPNPVNDVINIDTPIDLTNRIATVFDVTGKKLINKRLTNNTLNVSKLNSGIYVLRLESQGKSISRKFVKE